MTDTTRGSQHLFSNKIHAISNVKRKAFQPFFTLQVKIENEIKNVCIPGSLSAVCILPEQDFHQVL